MTGFYGLEKSIDCLEQASKILKAHQEEDVARNIIIIDGKAGLGPQDDIRCVRNGGLRYLMNGCFFVERDGIGEVMLEDIGQGAHDSIQHNIPDFGQPSLFHGV